MGGHCLFYNLIHAAQSTLLTSWCPPPQSNLNLWSWQSRSPHNLQKNWFESQILAKTVWIQNARFETSQKDRQGLPSTDLWDLLGLWKAANPATSPVLPAPTLPTQKPSSPQLQELLFTSSLRLTAALPGWSMLWLVSREVARCNMWEKQKGNFGQEWRNMLDTLRTVMSARPLAITSVKVTTTSLTFPLPSWKKSILATHSILRRERGNGFENLIASTGESTEAISNHF